MSDVKRVGASEEGWSVIVDVVYVDHESSRVGQTSVGHRHTTGYSGSEASVNIVVTSERQNPGSQCEFWAGQ